MRSRQPVELDARAILGAALDAKGESEWHREPGADGRYCWHASALSACSRQQVLLRAAAERGEFVPEPDPLETRLVFNLGHHYHALMQDGIKACPQYQLLGVEMGGRHPEIPLAALADIVFLHEDEPYIAEIKTESSFAGKHRREEKWLAADNETMTSARREHVLQIAAQALVLEATAGVRIERAWAIYVQKESGEVDQQPVVIDDRLRGEVGIRVHSLEARWEQYLRDQQLPELLPVEMKEDKRYKPPRQYAAPPWQCRPKSDTDPAGLYCRVRAECMSRKVGGDTNGG